MYFIMRGNRSCHNILHNTLDKSETRGTYFPVQQLIGQSAAPDNEPAHPGQSTTDNVSDPLILPPGVNGIPAQGFVNET